MPTCTRGCRKAIAGLEHADKSDSTFSVLSPPQQAGTVGRWAGAGHRAGKSGDGEGAALQASMQSLVASIDSSMRQLVGIMLRDGGGRDRF